MKKIKNETTGIKNNQPGALPSGAEPGCHTRMTHHPEALKAEMTKRLNRIEGQIRGVSRLVASDTYCDDILHQLMAIDSALSGVKKTLLKAHIEGCVADQLKNGDKNVIEELMVTMTKMMK